MPTHTRTILLSLMHLLRAACACIPSDDPIWRNLNSALFDIEKRLGEPHLYQSHAERRRVA